VELRLQTGSLHREGFGVHSIFLIRNPLIDWVEAIELGSCENRIKHYLAEHENAQKNLKMTWSNHDGRNKKGILVYFDK
jgi:hypothetical protein